MFLDVFFVFIFVLFCFFSVDSEYLDSGCFHPQFFGQSLSSQQCTIELVLSGHPVFNGWLLSPRFVSSKSLLPLTKLHRPVCIVINLF